MYNVHHFFFSLSLIYESCKPGLHILFFLDKFFSYDFFIYRLHTVIMLFYFCTRAK